MSAAEDIFGRIADGELVIIDGGTGTQLQAEGVPMDDVAWSARANLERPDMVQRVHEEYIRAGAEVIIANTYAASRAARQAAAETGLPVWLGVSPFRLQDGRLVGLPDLGDGESFDDLLGALVNPALAAVTVMHAKPEATLDAIGIIRRHFAGPVGVYAETGDWQPPNWVFDGLTPAQYLEQAIAWADRGARLIGGCCGVGPEHIRLLADRLPPRVPGA